MIVMNNRVLLVSQMFFKPILLVWSAFSLVFFAVNFNPLLQFFTFGIHSVFVNNWPLSYFSLIGLLLFPVLFLKAKWLPFLLILSLVVYFFIGVFWWMGISTIEFLIIFVLLSLVTFLGLAKY